MKFFNAQDGNRNLVVGHGKRPQERKGEEGSQRAYHSLPNSLNRGKDEFEREFSL
ncbi:MAG: hypothetical protein UU22_C0005G0002 [Parcubacteria group bacterium GW2011_GWA2_40_8]|nr:MAG: hypothetical protein UU22_C0005G0002 [Parcubacteria group bacterium GW2011_GWA2_40_8]